MTLFVADATLARMPEIFNPKSLDISALAWGRAPVGLLPKSLLKLWKSEPLPRWLNTELELAETSTVACLGRDFWTNAVGITPRLQHFVTFLVKSRIADIKTVRCFDQPWPQGLLIDVIPFGARSRNLLGSIGVATEPSRLMGITFGQLLAVPGLGIRSLLEITTLVEASLEIHWGVTADLAHGIGRVATDLGQGIGHVVVDAAIASQEPNAHWSTQLTQALQEHWVDRISGHDPRFRHLLPLGEGTLEERIERAVSDPAVAAPDIPRLLESLPAIRQVVERIRSQTLEESLSDLLVTIAGTQQARLEVLASRFGWNGEDPKTLQECGDQLGVTRERIRQIEAKALKRLGTEPLLLPKLDLAINVLEASCPLSVKDAADLLKEKSVSGRPFSPSSVIKTAQLLGRKTSLSIADVRGQRLVVSGSQERTLGKIIRLARALAGKSGVASIFQIVDSLNEVAESDGLLGIETQSLGEADVRRILAQNKACEFLDDDWFWITQIPDGRNRLENISKKILSVASPQPVSSVREGVRRAFRWRSMTNSRYKSIVLPPQSVMIRFYERHPDFQLHGEFVSTVKPLDYRKLLGDGERVLVDVIRNSSLGIMDRKTLMEACLSRGINENTLSVYTSYSAIMEHVGTDLWKLRGVRVDPAAIQAVREQNQLRVREVRVLDYGWTSDGKLWVGWRLPPIMGNVVLGIPSAVQRYVSNRSFSAFAKDAGRKVGQIGITDDGASYGYGTFLRYRGADESDTLLAEFDLSSANVYLSIADNSVLDETS